MKTLNEIIKGIEKKTLSESEITQNQGVIVVDSIEDYMKAHHAIHLNNLDKMLNINGED